MSTRAVCVCVCVADAHAVFFALVAWKLYKGELRPADTVSWRLLAWYAFIALFDTVGTYVIILSNAYVSAPMASLLSQVLDVARAPHVHGGHAC
jgi:hypothetical protein